VLIAFCLIVIVGCLIILLLGIGFDIASKRSAPTTLPIPIGLRNEISKILQTKLPVNIIRLVHERIRLAPNDLSLGGHLQGVIRQRIVVSAGLTVGLLTNDERSVAILAHEIAHVKHLDKFVPGIIVLSLLNISYCMVKFGKAGVLYAIAVLVITRYVTHRREYAADAHAVGLLGSKRMFAKTLLSLSADEEAFSHPSRDQRVDAIKRNLPILNPSAFWGGILARKHYWRNINTTYSKVQHCAWMGRIRTRRFFNESVLGTRIHADTRALVIWFYFGVYWNNWN